MEAETKALIITFILVSSIAVTLFILLQLKIIGKNLQKFWRRTFSVILFMFTISGIVNTISVIRDKRGNVNQSTREQNETNTSSEDDGYFAKHPSPYINDVNSTDESSQTTHQNFKLSTANEMQVQQFLNGTWEYDYVITQPLTRLYFEITINHNTLTVKLRDYTDYENKKNAPAKTIYSGGYNTQSSTLPVMLDETTQIGKDDILEIIPESSIEPNLRLYLQQTQPKIDASSYDEIYFIGNLDGYDLHMDKLSTN